MNHRLIGAAFGGALLSGAIEIVACILAVMLLAMIYYLLRFGTGAARKAQ